MNCRNDSGASLNDTLKGTERVLVIAPLGRDAEVACGMLTKAGIACRSGRDLAALEVPQVETLGALVLTEELLTHHSIEAISEQLDAQPAWSALAVILLVDPDWRRTAAVGRRDPCEAFRTRSGVILMQRPMHAASFVSVVRTLLLARRRQYELRDELEARARAEERARMLADEMKHRVKNAFAVASSIASQTFREATTLDDARASFSGRLGSMARAQDLIMANSHDKVDFRHLVEQTTQPYRSDEEPERFDLKGPQVLIAARAATAFAMAFHELATNAAKYGALSTAIGRVTIQWNVEAHLDGDALTVRWQECDGPPVLPPQRRGFGSRLVERALAHDLDGSAELDFDPDGVICMIRAAFAGNER